MLLKCEKKKIAKAEDIARILIAMLKTESEIDQDKEHFWSIGLNKRNVVKYIELVSLGTLDAAIVHPREVFRLAVTKGVSSMIIAHNHPSGDTDPSENDLKVTRRLKKAGEILGIQVLDHVIIGSSFGNSYYSFQEEGKLKKV